MPHQLSGRVLGRLCDDCLEPLAGATLRLVRLGRVGGTAERDDATRRAGADPKLTVRVLDDDQALARSGELLGETVLAPDGTFTVVLVEGYGGEAFDVDLLCGTLTGHPVQPRPVHLAVTTLSPQWREAEDGLRAAWDYTVPVRTWCAIRARLGWWSICGRVTVCGSQVPLPGLTVSAFDADWLQDDALGSATTDAGGHFRLDYTPAQFEKTPFWWLDVELTPGPDVYLRVTGPGGTVLLDEPRSRGREPDRENAGPCLCLQVCVEDQPPVTEPYPWFDHVGGYKLLTGIDSAPGGTGLTVGDSRAFYATLRLNGVLGRTLGGQPLAYRFETRDLAGGGWTPVRPAQMAARQIGTWERFSGGIPQTKAVVVRGVDGPDQIAVVPDADGWVTVPQDNSLTTGLFVPNNDLLGLDTESLTTQVHDLGAVTAGGSTAPVGLATDRFFGLRMMVRQAGAPASSAVVAGECERLALANTFYDNVQKQGSWVPIRTSHRLAVLSIDVQELVGHGCAKIEDSLTVLFTAAHPNLGPVSLTLTGPGGPYHYDLPLPVTADYSGTVTDLLGSANQHVVVANLPACGYQLSAWAELLLTTGDSSPLPESDFLVLTKK